MFVAFLTGPVVLFYDTISASYLKPREKRRGEGDSNVSVRSKWAGTHIPEFGAISGFGDVVITLAMSSEIEDFVLGTLFGILIQSFGITLESLP